MFITLAGEYGNDWQFFDENSLAPGELEAESSDNSSDRHAITLVTTTTKESNEACSNACK